MYDKKNVESFADRLRKYLNLQNISQTELAKLAGMSKHTIYKYLHNEREPKLASIRKLAAALEINPSLLLDGQEDILANEAPLPTISDDITLDQMVDVLEELMSSESSTIRLETSKQFQKAFSDLYSRLDQEKYPRLLKKPVP